MNSARLVATHLNVTRDIATWLFHWQQSFYLFLCKTYQINLDYNFIISQMWRETFRFHTHTGSYKLSIYFFLNCISHNTEAGRTYRDNQVAYLSTCVPYKVRSAQWKTWS